MTSRTEKVAAFRALHQQGCFIMPNPWDRGGAGVLSGLGFRALATTSAGYAFARGLSDGAAEISRAETIAHAAELAAATVLPVNADMEDGFAATASGVAETIALVADAGLAGMSIEDIPRGAADGQCYSMSEAVERVGAAAEAARKADIVLTARADGLIRNAYGLDEAIARLKAFAAAGAEVVYAPGLPDLAAIARVCAIDAPVNHLILPGGPKLTLEQIANAGVRRISLGSTLARAVLGEMHNIGRDVASGDFTRLYSAPSWATIRGEIA